MLLVGTSAAPHVEHHSESGAISVRSLPSGKITKTVVVTLTRFRNSTAQHLSTSRTSRPGFATPSSPRPVPTTDFGKPLVPGNQTRTTPQLTCPPPTNGCVISSELVWPTHKSNNSVSTPRFTSTLLPTSQTAPYQNVTSSTRATSHSPTTTSLHMNISSLPSHSAPGNATAPPISTSNTIHKTYPTRSSNSSTNPQTQPHASPTNDDQTQTQVITSPSHSRETHVLGPSDFVAWGDFENHSERARVQEGKAKNLRASLLSRLFVDVPPDLAPVEPVRRDIEG